MSTTVIDAYSDLDMHCPAEWYAGYKEGRLLFAGDAERSLSDPLTGAWTGSTFRFTLADTDSRLRAQLASFTDRYWSLPVAARMTTRANRAVLGIPYTIFVGPIIDAQPTYPLGWDITLGDAVSQGMLSDQMQLPWRMIRDGFITQLLQVSERLDLEQAEPIIYGIHDRATDEVSSPDTHGYRITPVYLGVEDVNGTDYHVWLVAGHACKEISIYVDDFPVTEGVDWLIPGQANWNAEFGAPYVDKVSSTYGNTRRYTLIYGKLGSAFTSIWRRLRASIADRCAVGDRTLTASVSGIEEEGDGSGDLLTNFFDCYEHFLINFVANKGPSSYQSGAWLENPVWSILDRAVEIVEASSIAAVKAIAEQRFPGGYPCAAAIGLRAGDRSDVRRWIADWNRSAGCRFGITHFGEIRLNLLHPTDAAKASARLYTDNYEVVRGSFNTSVRWPDHATNIPWRSDFQHTSSQWRTSGVVSDPDIEDRYGRSIVGAQRDYPFCPGQEVAEHLATLELRARYHPPRVIRFEVGIGPDGADRDSLAYRDLGDYIRYIHWDAVSETREERLAQVVLHQVRGSHRTVLVEALDCEDLIDFDLEGSPSGSWSPGSP